MKQLISIITVALLLSACAIGQRTNYSGKLNLQSLPFKNDQAIVVAVQDVRPTVVSGYDSPSRVGTLRSIAGVPWEVKTTSGAPLANDIAQSLTQALVEQGLQASTVAISPSDSEIEVVAKAMTFVPGTSHQVQQS